MRIVVIGGTGHVGTYLVPRLLNLGHEVVCVTRGQREPYRPQPLWGSVQMVAANREAEDAAGTFGKRILALRPDAVIDMICFTEASARQMVAALRGSVQHYLLTGTVWVHGHSVQIPTTEEQPRHPFGDYGIQKAAIEAYLLEEAHRTGFPATIVHPGHIVGPGWAPLNPAGHFEPAVFSRIAAGDELALPNLGLETVHHVHADDVAQVYVGALANWSTSVGQAFHAVSPMAVSLRGYAEHMYAWFGRETRLAFLPFEQWSRTVAAEDAEQTLEHISHSPCCSYAKAGRLLGYVPRYSSFQAVEESVSWLIEHGQVRV